MDLNGKFYLGRMLDTKQVVRTDQPLLYDPADLTTHATCVTCHFWRRSNNPAPEDYKLVRIVEIRPTKIDWTMLCHDCHSDK